MSLYQKVDRLLEVCDQWNFSISLRKSYWGRSKVDYLEHQVSVNGLEADPKDLGSYVNIPFPQTLRSMQSFLGRLNYYSRFIEDFAIYASVLYELREANFHEIRRFHKDIDCAASQDRAWNTQSKANKGRSPTSDGDRRLVTMKGHDHFPTERLNGDYTGGHLWEKSMIAFTMLKAKVAQTPVLRHFDPDRRPLIVV